MQKKAKPTPSRYRHGAVLYGLACHALFVVAVSMLGKSIYTGFSSGHGPWRGPSALLANILLVVQFPIIHSFLLTGRGRRFLGKCSLPYGSAMATTTYVIISALQLIAVCYLWSPTGIVVATLPAIAHAISAVLYASAWVYLALGMFDAGFSLQSGSLGWIAVFRRQKPCYPDMPSKRTFTYCRQPIYLAFALILWSSPSWTLDKLLVGIPWTVYLLLGPLHKERRLKKAFGSRFDIYCANTPYFFPRWRSISALVSRAAAFMMSTVGTFFE